jgi:hypothetical protein
MTMATICDAWMTELTTNVTGLQVATIPTENQHKYASWSVEKLATQQGGRHVAVYPNADAESAEAFTVGSLPGDYDTQRYTVLVWEDASADAVQLVDNDAANAAWLALYEAVKARFRVQANTALGEAGAYTRYVGGSFDLSGMARVITISFTVQIGRTFT